VIVGAIGSGTLYISDMELAQGAYYCNTLGVVDASDAGPGYHPTPLGGAGSGNPCYALAIATANDLPSGGSLTGFVPSHPVNVVVNRTSVVSRALGAVVMGSGAVSFLDTQVDARLSLSENLASTCFVVQSRGTVMQSLNRVSCMTGSFGGFVSNSGGLAAIASSYFEAAAVSCSPVGVIQSLATMPTTLNLGTVRVNCTGASNTCLAFRSQDFPTWTLASTYVSGCAQALSVNGQSTVRVNSVTDCETSGQGSAPTISLANQARLLFKSTGAAYTIDGGAGAAVLLDGTARTWSNTYDAGINYAMGDAGSLISSGL
jgi:hypothetical protein